MASNNMFAMHNKLVKGQMKLIECHLTGWSVGYMKVQNLVLNLIKQWIKFKTIMLACTEESLPGSEIFLILGLKFCRQ